jgi:hypothetical protein
MGLNEFIKKNEEQYGPKIAQAEWEKGKELMEALSSTGAVQLLERLGQSILSNPVLRAGQEGRIGLHKVLFVTGRREVEHVAILDNQENSFEIRDQNSPYGEKDKDMIYPTAFLIFQYNFNDWMLNRGSFFTGPKLESRYSCQAIVLGCSDSKEIGGIVTSMDDCSDLPFGYSSGAIKYKTQDLRMAGRMNDFLGKLYVPARPKKELPWH